MDSIPWIDPLEKKMATHSSILACKNPMDREAIVGYSLWGGKELDTTEQLTLSLSLLNKEENMILILHSNSGHHLLNIYYVNYI